jgi:N-acylneuraminate cytidylyltransferase
MGNLAIIPARGGSKRIPRKNIKDFLGKPIIAYSIEAAIKSELFDEIMVSTDDSEIAEVALKYGANVPFFRSSKNSDDFSSTMDVINEVLREYNQKLNMKFEHACCIYPTAPLIKVEHLKDGFNKLISNDFTSVFTAVEFNYPIWRGLCMNEDGISNMIWPKYLNTRSQDLPKSYHDAGQWYWFKPSELTESFFLGKPSLFKLQEMEVQDIDTLSDWEIAELKYKMLC